jgi:hypothetical protein
MYSQITLAVHNLNFAFEHGDELEYNKCVSAVVNAIRLMLFGSHTLEKESIHLKNSRNLKAQHRNIMTSISKLALSAKAASEANTSQFEDLVAKVKEESMDLLTTVQNFVTQCQDMHITIRHIDPRIVDSDKESRTHRRSDTASSGQFNLSLPNRARRQLSSESITRLQTYETKLQANIESLQSCIQKMQQSEPHSSESSRNGDLYSTTETSLPLLVAEFKETIKHLGHWLALLETIDLQQLRLLDQNLIKVNKQKLYNNSGMLFSAIQLATDEPSAAQVREVNEVVQNIEALIAAIMNNLDLYRADLDEATTKGLEVDTVESRSSDNTVTTNAGGVLTEEHYHTQAGDGTDEDAFSEDSLLEDFDKEFKRHTDTGSRHSETITRDQTAELASLASSRSPTDKLRKFFGEDAAAAASANFSPKQSMSGNVWYLGYDYRPGDIMFNMEGSVRGGTLEALIERLTLHDYLGKLVLLMTIPFSLF